MQLVLHNNSTEIMDLSLKKSIMEANTIHSSIVNNDHPVISKHENSSSTSTSKNKKSLSFSVDRLLKSVSDEDTSSTSSNSKIAVSNSPPFSSVSTNILPSTTSCLSAPFPIRPIVAHPSQPPTGPLSLLPPFYMPGLPGLYSHQVILRPPELFGQNPASFLPGIHGGSHHHHLPPMGSGKRKKSWTRAVFSHLQRKGLEKRFQMQKYITKPDRRQLAASLGLTDAQVKVWFQNRRMKWRHMESKERREQERQAAAGPGVGGGSSTKASSTTTSMMSPASASSILARSLPESSRFSSSTFLPTSSNIHHHASTRDPRAIYFDDEDDEDEDEDDEDLPRLVMNADSTGDPEIKVD